MDTTLSASVGDNGANKPDDIVKVQRLLGRHADWLAGTSLGDEGKPSEALDTAIRRFQADACGLLAPDGRVDAGGFTLRRLDKASIPHPAHPVFAPGSLSHAADHPTDAEYATAATTLGCEVAAIKAVSQVEVGITGPWEESGRPRILFERHIFSALTGRQYDASHPDIANINAGGYGLFSAQYPKLRRAAVLDETAALKSASWGAYQIVGRYHAQAGFADVATFVSAEMVSESKQLEAFVSFVGNNAALKKALQDKDWASFARLYNGPGYADNAYDTKMAAAYAALAPPAPAAAPAPKPTPRR